MPTKREDTRHWLLKSFEERLVSVFEAMAGERPAVRSEPLSSPPDQAEFVWRQDLQGIQGSFWVSAPESAWTELGQQVLRAAGIDDADAALLQSTYTETLGQALSGLAQDSSSRIQREITCAPGSEAPPPQFTMHWERVELKFPAALCQVSIGLEDRVLDALVVEEPSLAAAASVGAGSVAQVNNSKTFDLLLDVELPVSVSFGRAMVQLKDVIKLTSGSIVELNRSIAEPVEVIVNNCVIARGEVVVVEGNFGVRIQQVISRQERLRTLN